MTSAHYNTRNILSFIVSVFRRIIVIKTDIFLNSITSLFCVMQTVALSVRQYMDFFVYWG